MTIEQRVSRIGFRVRQESEMSEEIGSPGTIVTTLNRKQQRVAIAFATATLHVFLSPAALAQSGYAALRLAEAQEKSAQTYGIAIVVAALIIGASIYFGLRSKGKKATRTDSGEQE